MLMSDSHDRRDNSLLNLIYDEVKTTHAVAQDNGQHIAGIKSDVSTLKQDNRDQWEHIEKNRNAVAEHKQDHPHRVTVIQWTAVIGAMAAASTAAVALAHALGLGSG